MFKPLVIESYRPIEYQNKTYKRRLRINGYNALLIDEKLGTGLYYCRTKFVVLDDEDIKKACEILQVEYKPVSTYFHIDLKMCAFSSVS